MNVEIRPADGHSNHPRSWINNYLRFVLLEGHKVISISDIPINYESKAPARNLARRASRILGVRIGTRDVLRAVIVD